MALMSCNSQVPPPRYPLVRLNPDHTCDFEVARQIDGQDIGRAHSEMCEVKSVAGMIVELVAPNAGECGRITCSQTMPLSKKYVCNTPAVLASANCPIPAAQWGGPNWTLDGS